MLKIEEVVDELHRKSNWNKKREFIEQWVHQVIDTCASVAASTELEEAIKAVKNDL
jgi:predicted GTPase